MDRKDSNTNGEPQHISCVWFDELLNYLKANHPGFELTKLAADLDCHRERIRKIRQGESVLTLADVDVLRKKYGVNLLFLTDHREPFQLSGELSIVNEPNVNYGTDLKKENNQLRDQLSDKDKIIEMLEEKLGLAKHRKAS